MKVSVSKMEKSRRDLAACELRGEACFLTRVRL